MVITHALHMIFESKVQDYRTAYPQFVAKITSVFVCLLFVCVYVGWTVNAAAGCESDGGGGGGG